MNQYQPLKLISLNSNVSSTSKISENLAAKLSLSCSASPLVDHISQKPPVVVHADDSVQDTLHVLNAMRVKDALVENSRDEVVGVVTKLDLMGQRTTAFGINAGLARSEISIRDVMMPRSELFYVTQDVARNANVGDVVETLKRIGDTYILITENAVNTSVIQALISTRQVNELLEIHLPLAVKAFHMKDMHFALSGTLADY